MPEGLRKTVTGSDYTIDPPLQRAKAIRANCLECMGDNSAEVRRCEITDCHLWPRKSGRRPSRNGQEAQNQLLGRRAV